MNAGKSWSPGSVAGASPAAQIAMPTSRKSGELQHDHDAGADQRHSGVLQRAGGEQPLDDQMIGAVRGRGEQRAADQAAEQRVGRGEVDTSGRSPSACRLARARSSAARRPPARFQAIDQRADAAGQVHRELKHVGPHHGLEARRTRCRSS